MRVRSRDGARADPGSSDRGREHGGGGGRRLRGLPKRNASRAPGVCGGPSSAASEGGRVDDVVSGPGKALRLPEEPSEANPTLSPAAPRASSTRGPLPRGVRGPFLRRPVRFPPLPPRTRKAMGWERERTGRRGDGEVGPAPPALSKTWSRGRSSSLAGVSSVFSRGRGAPAPMSRPRRGRRAGAGPLATETAFLRGKATFRHYGWRVALVGKG